MYNSPSTLASREAKKLSSKIKSQTTNFDKLVVSWTHNCSETSQLLEKLNKNCESMASVMKTSQSSDFSSLKALFPDLFEKLVGNLVVEIEDLCLQLRVFMRILRDVNTAMQLQAYECTGILSSITAVDTVFSSGVTMSSAVQELLDLQRKYSHHNQELVHKEQMVKSLLQPRDDLQCNHNVDRYWLQQADVQKVLRAW
mmetsp:Transcript_25233/g.42566  ORF Transcript_25233/g.42566 Transcript_25233/m.42566 type:complete len:199 (-) Transcript_25233:309-905(-)|eukprot:CAMPEP_0114480324 /NCGR_PEP_ID=MMETSP0104-20121206/17068_1 /TAXON_ID=37642 ORGANISM="Paraphysomonas imperforata, Strain PA2" /NCGR_SAMPLE_ID=MMETSP0104 /ASSEMBLY_ACC=CAM_ASM_000202 /LENGTH=198 /DNA_ID=CAMNT_0001655795 /DNA_START=97 /DNA_END=690 /DNA_ORIENTATION=-